MEGCERLEDRAVTTVACVMVALRDGCAPDLRWHLVGLESQCGRARKPAELGSERPADRKLRRPFRRA
eukprot:1559372-Heterocapsa_arctica.AAC.1